MGGGRTEGDNEERKQKWKRFHVVPGAFISSRMSFSVIRMIMKAALEASAPSHQKILPVASLHDVPL